MGLVLLVLGSLSLSLSLSLCVCVCVWYSEFTVICSYVCACCVLMENTGQHALATSTLYLLEIRSLDKLAAFLFG